MEVSEAQKKVIYPMIEEMHKRIAGVEQVREALREVIDAIAGPGVEVDFKNHVFIYPDPPAE